MNKQQKQSKELKEINQKLKELLKLDNYYDIQHFNNSLTKEMKDKHPEMKFFYDYLKDIENMMFYYRNTKTEGVFLSNFEEMDPETDGEFVNVFAIILGEIPFDVNYRKPLNENGYLKYSTPHNPLQLIKAIDLECITDDNYIKFFDYLLDIFKQVGIKKNYDDFREIYTFQLYQMYQCYIKLNEYYGPTDRKHLAIFNSFINFKEYKRYKKPKVELVISQEELEKKLEEEKFEKKRREKEEKMIKEKIEEVKKSSVELKKELPDYLKPSSEENIKTIEDFSKKYKEKQNKENDEDIEKKFQEMEIKEKKKTEETGIYPLVFEPEFKKEEETEEEKKKEPIEFEKVEEIQTIYPSVSEFTSEKEKKKEEEFVYQPIKFNFDILKKTEEKEKEKEKKQPLVEIKKKIKIKIDKAMVVEQLVEDFKKKLKTFLESKGIEVEYVDLKTDKSDLFLYLVQNDWVYFKDYRSGLQKLVDQGNNHVILTMFFKAEEKDKEDVSSEWKQWGKAEQNYPSGFNLMKVGLITYFALYVSWKYNEDKTNMFVDMEYKNKTKEQFEELANNILVYF
jgi:hypothetical protein